MNVLLTGGAGYIGSHTAVVLANAGYNVTLLDNFSNSSKKIIGSLEKIIGKVFHCVQADVRNTKAVEKILIKYQIDAVIHFAGLKAVGESASDPLLYYANNVQGSISILQAMQNLGIRTLVFSSSATVYGDPKYLPYDECHPTAPANVYGKTKLQVEIMLQDLAASNPEWKIIILRYFNPVGAHESGLIGEDPNGIPNNLMPYISKVAAGELPHLNVYGNDYQTRDGTGERDYIHVMDLADGHMAALRYLESITSECCEINLGTGNSTSVLELIAEFEKASGKKIKKIFSNKRPGDLPAYYAQSDKAKKILKWEPSRTLQDACQSTLSFIKKGNK